MFKKIGLVAALLAVVFVAAGPSHAASSVAKPEAAFRAAFPQIPMDSIAPSEIPGLYEVVSGQSVFYYYPGKDLIVTGEIIGKDLRSRTAEKRGAIAAEAAKSLPLEKAVKIGNGKKTVIEFTDPDCPYCKKASEYLAKRSDLTRYVFFAPLAHPGALPKIQYILGAADKASAYEAMMRGEEIPAGAPAPTDAVKALAQEHLSLARKVGVQATPTFFIKGEQVLGADIDKLENLLK